MALSTRKEEEKQIEVPMSSMIDVVFLLLIYFVWTYEVEDPEAHLAVNLPGAPPPPEEEEPPPQPPFELKVYRDSYQFRGRQLSLNMIERSLSAIAEGDAETTVVIKVSEAAPTAQLVHLLDRCKAAGLKNLNVVTM